MKVFTADLDNRLIDLVRSSPALYDRKDHNWKNTAAREKTWTAIAKQLGRKEVECKARWKSIRDSYKKVKTKAKGDKWSERDLRSKYFSEKFTFLDVILDEDPTSSSPHVEGDDGSDPKVYVFEQSFKMAEDGSYCMEEYNVRNQDLLENSSLGGEASDRTPSVEVIDVQEENASGRPKRKSSFRGQDLKKVTKKEAPAVVKDVEVESKSPTVAGEHPVESFFRSMAHTVMGFSPDLIAETRLKVCQVVTSIEIKDLQRKHSSK